MRRTGELVRFLKFCAVGASGILVDEGLLWLLTEFAGLFYLLSAAISTETAILSNYTLNDYFTFPDRRSAGSKSFLARLAKFNLVSLAGVGIKLGIVWVLTSVLGVHYLLSNLVGIVIAFLWNYLVNTWWTWK
jgi:dolichol-phosphate mannosyltransferase